MHLWIGLADLKEEKFADLNLVVKMGVRVISLDPQYRTLQMAAIAIQGIVIVNRAILYIAKDSILANQEQACSWITRSSTHQKWPNTQEYGC